MRLHNAIRSHGHWALVVGVILLATGCGYQGSAGSRFGIPGGGGNSTFGDGPGDYQIDPNAFNPQAPNAPEYTNELKRCDQLRNLADSITGPCGPDINRYADELSQNCYRWFQQMYNYECSGLENRLRNALNACSSDLSASFQFLNSSCQTSLRRFFK